MKKMSLTMLAETVESRRKAKKITQARLSEITGINRSLLSRLESGAFTPSLEQLEALGEALDFDPADLFVEQGRESVSVDGTYRIAVAGAGYVGLSLAVLLAQHHEVTAVCTKPDKAEMIRQFRSPIQHLGHCLSDLLRQVVQLRLFAAA